MAKNESDLVFAQMLASLYYDEILFYAKNVPNHDAFISAMALVRDSFNGIPDDVKAELLVLLESPETSMKVCNHHFINRVIQELNNLLHSNNLDNYQRRKS